MEIVYNVPHAFNPDSTQVDNAWALNSLLEALILMNLAYLRFHAAPPLYGSGVRYGRTKIWEPTPALYAANKSKDELEPKYWIPDRIDGLGKKRGDCKSLTAALIAQYVTIARKKKVPMHVAREMFQPVFRWAPRNDGSGLLDFHILVRTPKGFEDPSKELGMGQQELSRFFVKE